MEYLGNLDIMVTKFNALVLAAALSAIAGSASALTITSAEGDCASDASLSGCSASAARRDLGNVELASAGNGSFYSLGVGQSASFYFDRQVTGSLSVSEVTFGRAGYYEETALVYGGVVTDGGYDFSALLGSLSNKSDDGFASLAFSGRYDALRFVDTTEVPAGMPANADGFDIDSIEVAAVPLPASALMLIAGLGGLGMVRRRKA